MTADNHPHYYHHHPHPPPPYHHRGVHTSSLIFNKTGSNSNNSGSEPEYKPEDSITTFTKLRDDVFKELSHHEQVKKNNLKLNFPIIIVITKI